MNFASSFPMLLAFVTAGTLSAQSDWDDPFPPHRIADHLYYVGSKGLASYLITTTNGHILINSSFERTVPIIRTNIEALGFKFTDIKILLTSHAHSDHASGHALVKELTGARVEVMEGDAQVIASGGEGQYLYTEAEAWRPCVVDRVLKDGDTVTLGEAQLTTRLTPGHTRGCTTLLMRAADGGKSFDVVIIGSPNVNPGYVLVNNRDYPEIAADYEKTFRLLKSFPCDIFLGAHGSYYGMEAKYARLQKNPKAHPFIDREGYHAYVDDRAKAFREAVRKQQKSSGTVQQDAGTNTGSGGFAFPVSTANRRFIDQTGKVYLLKTMSSWAMSQNCTDAEITQALEGLKALRFNAVTVSPFGVHMNDSFGDRYKNKAGQNFFSGKPHASSLGPAWSSMDWVMHEATRLEMTVVFSFFLSWKDTGTVPDMIAGGTTNAYNFGKAVATRYASYSNIVWHVMGDYKWRYNEGPALALDDIFHGIRDAEGSSHRLIIAEPANGSTSFDQFISAEGADGYKWFKQSADTIYHYRSNSVEQFDKVYNRAATGSYPVVDIEPPYVNAPHYKDQQLQELRERNYATFIRGGAGINFGHEKWWPHGVTGLFDGGPGWLNILSEAPQLDAKHAWTILDAYVTDPTWMPDAGTFLKTGLGSGDDQAASGYSSGAALVYFPTSRPVIVDTTKIGRGSKVRLQWYDPTSGNYTIIASSEAKASDRSLSYPSKRHADGFNDWVLVAEGH